MKKRYIDPIGLKMAIAINNMSDHPKSLEDIIDEEPDAVVRCDYCKHLRHDACNDEYWCQKTGDDIDHADTAKHFCGYGEQK